MSVLTGRVENGRIVTDAKLPEGARVTIVAADDEDAFELTASEEKALLASLEQVRRRKVLPFAKVLASLRRA